MKKLWICSRRSMFSVHYTKLCEKATKYTLYFVIHIPQSVSHLIEFFILDPSMQHNSKATPFKILSQSNIVSSCKLTLCLTSSIRINRREFSIILHIFKANSHEITEVQYGSFWCAAAIFATHHFTTFAVFRFLLWYCYSSLFGYFVLNFYRCCSIFAPCTLAIS